MPKANKPEPKGKPKRARQSRSPWPRHRRIADGGGIIRKDGDR